MMNPLQFKYLPHHPLPPPSTSRESHIQHRGSSTRLPSSRFLPIPPPTSPYLSTVLKYLLTPYFVPALASRTSQVLPEEGPRGEGKGEMWRCLNPPSCASDPPKPVSSSASSHVRWALAGMWVVDIDSDKGTWHGRGTGIGLELAWRRLG